MNTYYGLSSSTLIFKSFLIQNTFEATIEHVLLNYIFIGVSIVGFILSIYVIYTYRKEKLHNIFLGIFTFTTAFILLELVLYRLEDFEYYPKVPLYKSLVFIWGPTLYLYFKTKSVDQKIALLPILKHYSIFLISLLFLLIINIISLKTDVSEREISKFIHVFLTNNWIKSIYCGFYIFLMIKQYLKDKKQIDKLERNWTKTLISFFVFIFLIACFRAEFAESHKWDYLSKYLAAYSFSTFIIMMLVLNILFPHNSSSKNSNDDTDSNTKYKNSGLTLDMSQRVKSQLKEIMETKKPYLDHTLNLQGLANILNIDRYSLSQVINQEFGKNFYEFVNDYRINESIHLIESNPKRIELITDLIYESGFNNKVSFYKAFKKRKHKTPSQYLKEFMQSV